MQRSIVCVIALVGALALFAGPARAQRPAVNPGGIVNAASFGPAGQPGYGVGAGSLASVFGRNFAATTAYADRFPLPIALGGTSVTIAGVPAPLLSVSPTQINLQVPFFEAGLDDNVPLVVTTAVGASEPLMLNFRHHLHPAPGIFTLDSSGCGRAAVFNVATDGSVSLNGPDASAEPGEYITIYGTGMAAYADPHLPMGLPAPTDPPVRYFEGFYPILRGVEYPLPPVARFFGAAPGYAGLDQFNLRLPADAPDGCSVPLQLSTSYWIATQTIPISIRRGGGRCVDPPPDGVAVLRWTKTVSSGLEPPPPGETLAIEFASAVGKQPPVLRDPSIRVTDHPPFRTARYCRGFEDQQLDAGALQITTPASSLRVVPVTSDGQLRYNATLPAGSIGAGVHRIVAEGGAQVSEFTTAVTFPSPIQVTTDLRPGTFIPRGGITGFPAINIRWQGGDADSVVTVRIIAEGSAARGLTVPAAEGEVYILDDVPYGHVEVVVTQTPDPAKVQRFQAAGLTLGGWHYWSYEFRFGGLTH